MQTLASCLRDHHLETLFIDVLGWERATGTTTLTSDGRVLRFHALAHKRGLQVFWCPTDRMVLLNRGLLRKFQHLVTRTVHEHILIFTSEEPRKQVWEWAIRLPDGRKRRHREHPFFSDAPPPPFLDRLAQLRFGLEEENSIGLVDALDRARRALDAAPELDLFAKWPRYAVRSDELARAMQQGDVGAFQRFIVFHLPLARKITKRLRRWFGMDEEDALQIGVLGLIEAARRFRPERGFQFSTYATWWVKHACQRYGPEMALLIHVPNNLFWTCYRHAIDVERLRMAGGPCCVRDQVAELECMNPWFADRWRAYLRVRNIGSLSDRDLLRRARRITDSSHPPSEGLLRLDMAAQVRAAIGRLHPRDAAVIRLRYGLDGPERTLEHIGQQMNLTKERIRQIECRAENRLRTLLCEEEPSAAPCAEEPPNPCPEEGAGSEDVLASAPSLAEDSQHIQTLIQNTSG